jgi:hypothetical protein
MNLDLSRQWQQRWILALLGGLVALSGWLGTGSTHAQQLPFGGGGKNVVVVVNDRDGGTQIQGRVHLNRIPGPLAVPSNIAMATSSCTRCESLAVALQINVIARSAQIIAPENVAVASNAGCSECVTMAWAVMYAVTVDDPTKDLPPNIQASIAALQQQLARASSAPSICDAAVQINAVLAQFSALATKIDSKLNGAPNPIPCIGIF